MDKKTCNTCNNEKSIEEFSKKRGSYTGRCLECQAEYNRRYYKKNAENVCDRVRRNRQRIREWYRDLKATLSCEKCGEDHPACIQFHHADDNKEACISEMVCNSVSIETIMKEIEKCKVLCANCHFKLHYEQAGVV